MRHDYLLFKVSLKYYKHIMPHCMILHVYISEVANWLLLLTFYVPAL